MNARLLSVYAQVEACKARLLQMATANSATRADPSRCYLMPYSPDDFEREASYLSMLAQDALNIGD